MQVALDTLTALDEFFFEPIAKHLHSLHPNLPSIADRVTSVQGSWHLSPKQHAIEFVIYNILFALAVWLAAKRLPNWSTLVSETTVPLSSRGWFPRLLDALCTVAMLVFYGSAIYYKTVRGHLLFLLQPCHIFSVLLLLLCFWPEKSLKRHVLFHIHIHCLWGALLALVFPDFRDYGMYLEIHFFIMQHLALVIVPLVWVYTGRFPLVSMYGRGFSVTIFAFFVHALYHSFVLASLALYTGNNLNYLMSPPTGILESFGSFYRPVMYAFCLVLTIIVRFVVIGTAAKLLRSKPVDVNANGHFEVYTSPAVQHQHQHQE
ncbi:hypothetical protein CAOG_01402 [Capsaspora owczarzaki ATCC 30864]|uniref:Transmembrane protein n=1 Tax=Capsaspora owczarzaki (strain ATCC 30864) TaxID=595528 RepID=A0A0D2U4C6_CAPO3|nr:hypothetical protein CAOG_01402 [Capsaspora owczarzaki ATCC 30864]KJE90021.1 hypothetical protein, variant [Capsaspora owczarzaki ATCC 30864]|eukprot:XP_004349922.1 hypothetical protein CAOG_01402 [Capsaspora owczarzaki ATCC 30864]